MLSKADETFVIGKNQFLEQVWAEIAMMRILIVWQAYGGWRSGWQMLSA